ncbi:unnamed protein product [Lactuca virosa]|uniref:Uncharacterized protein n=1 Tax=Lactuca virosa TaxID=75947 RepID=A0AAU9PJ00_9ASTR|nr:unnamed protein product [Lactuca virosa]
MASEVEGGKQVVREQIATGKFVPGKPRTLLEHTRAMHMEVKSFLETDFASYLHVCELDIEGLRQLCSDSDAERKHLEAITSGPCVAFLSPGVVRQSNLTSLLFNFIALFTLSCCIFVPVGLCWQPYVWIRLGG